MRVRVTCASVEMRSAGTSLNAAGVPRALSCGSVILSSCFARPAALSGCSAIVMPPEDCLRGEAGEG